MNLNSNFKTVLCFGDSNTWGYIPNESTVSVYRKYPTNKIWTGVLQNMLGDKYEVISDGVNSRTIMFEDPRPNKDGRVAYPYLKQCFFAHDPIEYLIIFLGLNDLKSGYNEALLSFSKLVDLSKTLQSQIDSKKPQIIYIITSPVDTSKEYAASRYPNGTTISEQFRDESRRILKEKGIDYIVCLNINDLGSDGVHLTESAHNKLGHEAYIKINEFEHTKV